jgi:predicted membrane protein
MSKSVMMEKTLESENSQTHKIKILSIWAGIALLIFGLGFLLNTGIDIVIAILLSLAILLCMLLIRFVLSVMSKQAQEHR